MTQPLKANQGSVFVQTTPGEAPEYVGCVDVSDLPDPRGSISLIRCRDRNGNFQTVGEIQGEPDVVSATITALIYPDSDILDRIGNCKSNLFVTQRDCGKAGIFNNWARASILHHATLTNFTRSNLAMRVAGDAATRALEFTGWGVLHLSNKLKFNRQSIAETTSLNAVAVDGATVCAGDCGEAVEPCSVGFIGGDAPGGSPAGRADIWHMDDGATWANTVGAAGHPFVAAQDIKAAAIFDLDRSTKRWLVARESVIGEALKIAYSDDGGDSWTLVTVGSVTTEGVQSAKALFVLDRDHLYLGTTEGNIYFSDDAGVTWALQSGAVDADGGEALNAVRFLDADNGYAAGENGALVRTDDGGDTWSAVDTPNANNLTALEVLSPFRVIIGTNADGLYQTRDTGAHWSQKTFTGQSTSGTVKALVFVDELVGFMVHNPASGQGYVHRSIDGGHSWERLNTPANSGLNDLVACDGNHAFVVGAATVGTGFVAKITS